MKRLSSRPVERRDSRPSYFQVFTAMVPLIPLVILAAISGLFPSPVLAQEKTGQWKMHSSNAH
jgi:hypothetical protein